MTTEGFKRKLTAILSADVEGYSRLMDDNEEATVRTLTAYRSVMSDLVQQYRGRVVDATGDNLMAEFTSVVGLRANYGEWHRMLRRDRGIETGASLCCWPWDFSCTSESSLL